MENKICYPLEKTILDTVRKFLDKQLNSWWKDIGIKIVIQEDVAIIRFSGLISKAEKDFSKDIAGQELLRKMYREIFHSSSMLLEGMITDSTKKEVKGINVEFEPEHSELMMVIHFKENLSCSKN